MEINEKTPPSLFLFPVATILIFALALATRSVGLFHGLEETRTFHPDTLKQVVAVRNFLQGQPLWYTGSLAYDGYPYGLNHIDAALVRVVWPLFTGLAHFLHPAADWPSLPSVESLLVLCRLFRVLYGMLAFGLFAWMLQRRKIRPTARLAWMTAAALAPVSSVVTHSASGDVGTDLFVLAALAALLAGMPRPGWKAFGFCGFFLGCAFSAKYHAILAGMAPGIVWLALPLSPRTRVNTALVTAAGFVAGFVLLTPQIGIRPEKTLSLIGDNIAYIRDYNVDPAFLAQPLFTRLSSSLSANVPLLVSTLGPAVCLLAAVALVAGLARGARERVLRHPGVVWDLSLLTMAMAVALISVASKPQVQPFHFSFLVAPLLLGAAGIWNRRPFRGSGVLLGVLIAVQLLGDIRRQNHEFHFWSREDTYRAADRLTRELLEPAEPPQRLGDFGSLAVEGKNLSVFRNRPARLSLPEAEAWKNAPREAVPATPHSFSPDWVFLDLPFFPRDDRLIRVGPDAVWDRSLITASVDQPVPLRVRGGELPSELHLTWNGRSSRHSLKPLQELELELPADGGTPFTRGQVEAVRHRLRMRAEPGHLHVRVGPAPVPRDPAVPPPAEKLARSRFLEGRFRIGLGADHHVLRAFVHLPPGRYRFELQSADPANLPTLQIDRAQLPHPDHRIEAPLLSLRDGRAGADVDLPSPGLFSRLLLRYPRRPREHVSWSLKPILPLPEPPPRIDESPSTLRPRAGFAGGDLRLGSIRVRRPNGSDVRGEGTLDHNRGAPFTLSLTAAFQGGAWELRNSHVVFVHLLDASDRQVFARDIRLSEIPVASLPRQYFWDLGALDLPPGEYRVGIGVYDPATRLRMKPTLLESNTLPGRRAGLFTLRIREPKP